MDRGGRFVNADGKSGVDGTNDARSAWCAYTAEADGKPVTAAMFDHPANLRHPATWYTMNKPFVYISGTLNLSKRGWGLQIIEGLMDEVKIESSSSGTTVVMSKAR